MRRIAFASRYWQRTAPDGFVVVRQWTDGERWREERRVTHGQAAPAPR